MQIAHDLLALLLTNINRQQKTQFKHNNDRLMSLMNRYHDGDIEIHYQHMSS